MTEADVNAFALLFEEPAHEPNPRVLQRCFEESAFPWELEAEAVEEES